MKRKPFFAAFLVALVLATVLTLSVISFLAKSPIEISTAADLQKIGADASYPLNGSYKLTADIDLSGIDWKPIGRSGAPFKGTFDGDGHVISGLTIGTATAPKSITDVYCSDGANKVGDYLGMFGFAESAVFKNFALKDVSIFIKTGNRQVGGIVGGLDNNPSLGRTHFENVAILSGTISYQSADNASIRVGGFVGLAKNHDLKFLNCYMGATVIGDSNTNRAMVGGFLGNSDNRRISFENCVLAGDVTNLSSHANSAAAYFSCSWSSTGNINNVTLTNCYAHATNLKNSSATFFFKNETVIPVGSEGQASLYTGLSETAWVVKDYYHPMLKTFATYATTWSVIPLSSAEEFAKIGADAAYPLDGTYLITENIDLSEKVWTPIGTASAPFTGKILGNGFVISGLTIGTADAPVAAGTVKASDGTGDLISFGLFGKVKGATVKDLALTEVSLFVDGTAAATEKRAGAIAGQAEGLMLENVAVISGEISLKNQDTKACYVGGLVGDLVDSSASSISVKKAFVGLTLIASSKNRAMIGGFVGNINNRPSAVEDSVSAAIIKNKTPSDATGAAGTGCLLSNWAGSQAALDKINEKGTLTSVYTHPYLCSAGSKSSIMKHNSELEISLSEALIPTSYGKLSDAWETKEGYYPMLKTFKALAAEVVEVVGIPIKSQEDLAKIGKDEEYPADGQYYLANDITLSGQWTPIESFSGVLDGNGHCIDGLTIGTPSAPKVAATAGLISELNGTVKNLSFRNVYIHTADAAVNWSHEDGVGTVAGKLSGAAVIENVALLSGTLMDVGSHETTVGGIAGIAVQAGWKIKDCFSALTIIGGYGAVNAEDNRALLGGIIGNARVKGTVENCLTVGTVTTVNYGFADPIGSFYKYMGALSEVKNCYYLSSVLQTGRYGYAYGFAGGVTFEATDSISVTEVTPAKLLDGTTIALGDGWVQKAGEIPYPTSAAETAPSRTALTPALFKDLLTEALTQGELKFSNASVGDDLIRYAQNSMALYDSDITLTWQVPFSITEAATHTKAGKATGTLKITSSVGEETLVLETVIDQIPTLAYEFTGNQPGRADGTITVTFPTADGEEYELRWGNSEGPLKGYAPLRYLTADKTSVTHTTAKYSLIPEEATVLCIVKDGLLLNTLPIPADRRLTASTPKYLFGIMSDGHMADATTGAKSAQMHNILRAMELFSSAKASFVTVLGDNTTYNTDHQLSFWTVVQDKYADLPLYSVLGNHDILPHNTNVSDVQASFDRFAAVFKNTQDFDYTVEKNGDLFIYLGLGKAENLTAYNGLSLHDSQIQWLDGVLKQYYVTEEKSGQVFLIFHLFPVDNEYAATASNGFNPDSSRKLEAVLEKYPGVIWFSGHNHYSFDCNKNIYVTDSYTMLHAPSVGTGGTLNGVGHTLGGEVYLVAVYEDYVIVKAYNAYTEEVQPGASFLVGTEKDFETEEDTNTENNGNGNSGTENEGSGSNENPPTSDTTLSISLLPLLLGLLGIFSLFVFRKNKI